MRKLDGHLDFHGDFCRIFPFQDGFWDIDVLTQMTFGHEDVILSKLDHLNIESIPFLVLGTMPLNGSMMTTFSLDAEQNPYRMGPVFAFS